MRYSKFLHLHQKGDTIVEVLIAITIVSMVLSGAYISASNSLNGARQSQERVEALKLVEEQLERLKAKATFTGGIFSFSSPFCINDSNNLVDAAPAGSCINSVLGVSYKLSIARDATDKIFTVNADWERLGGGTAQNTKITYKLHQP